MTIKFKLFISTCDLFLQIKLNYYLSNECIAIQQFAERRFANKSLINVKSKIFCLFINKNKESICGGFLGLG